MTYRDELDEMKTEIHDLAALRNAQAPNTEHWWHYQDRITELTGDMRALESLLPTLEAADREMERAKRAMDLAQADADGAMDALWRVVKWSGGIGLFGVLVALLWHPAWLLVLSGVALVITVGAIWWGIRIRPDRYGAVDEARDEWFAARTKRDVLVKRLGSEPAPVSAPLALPAALSLALTPTPEPIEDAELVD